MPPTPLTDELRVELTALEEEDMESDRGFETVELMLRNTTHAHANNTQPNGINE
jgi:hypothetical protein